MDIAQELNQFEHIPMGWMSLALLPEPDRLLGASQQNSNIRLFHCPVHPDLAEVFAKRLEVTSDNHKGLASEQLAATSKMAETHFQGR